MPMPEAAVHENHFTAPSEYEIRRTGQSFVVKSISEASPVDEFSNNHFRFRILVAHERHLSAALLFRK